MKQKRLLNWIFNSIRWNKKDGENGPGLWAQKTNEKKSTVMVKIEFRFSYYSMYLTVLIKSADDFTKNAQCSRSHTSSNESDKNDKNYDCFFLFFFCFRFYFFRQIVSLHFAPISTKIIIQMFDIASKTKQRKKEQKKTNYSWTQFKVNKSCINWFLYHWVS